MPGYLTWLLNSCVPYANKAGRPWKNLGGAESDLPVSKGGLQERRGQISSAKSVVIGQGGRVAN